MINDNIAKIKSVIGNVCQNNNIDISKIVLLAVSKTVNAEVVVEAVKSNHFDFAENKVQELANKRKFFAEKNISGLNWHLIGHLQSNKVKLAVDNADLFHCLDSIKLAAKINEYSASINKIFPMLIQINSSGEESKFGITPEVFPDFLKELEQFKNIVINGLMSIGKYNSMPEESRTEFKLMKRLFDYGKSQIQENCDFKYLSMGMSHDFSVAIEEGANIIRVGTAIFGERDYGSKQ